MQVDEKHRETQGPDRMFGLTAAARENKHISVLGTEATAIPITVPEQGAATPPTAVPEQTEAALPAADSTEDWTPAAPAKPKRQRRAPTQPKEKKFSALDAAAKVLPETGQPMGCNELVGAMAAKGYWTSPGAGRPTATVSDTATVTRLGQGVGTGLTAGIGFWHNKNGQALITSFNGGPSSTVLPNWQAASFPNLYGAGAGANSLAGKTNAQVATYFQTLFALGGTQVQAQVLAVALKVYARTSSLGGTAGVAYGFTVSATRPGARSYSVGTEGRPSAWPTTPH
jgi:hypothetical protein